jgi:2',3'-cyclic-nucleotide 2'-phosphodiesterase (5'-nucleotidase family)
MTTPENVLKILHLNDLHSHFENYPKITRFFSEKSAGFSDVLRFDLGDNIDRSHPLSEATLGKANIALMNDLQLTAATIGNNEGLGLQKAVLDGLYDRANFDVVLANLKDKGVQPSWAVDKKTVTTSFGMTIDIFGLTAPYPLAYPPMGWDILDPEQVLAEHLSKSKADFTILLSHLGWRFDEKAASQFDKLNLIIGAHTHHLYEYGKYIDETMLAAAGRYGEHVGEITLRFDDAFRCIQSEMIAENTHHLATRPGDKEFIEKLAGQGHALLQADVIAQLPRALPNAFPDYEATHFVADIFAQAYQVPAVIVNSGMIVQPIPQNLTRDALHEVLPHSIRLVKFTVTGAELTEMLAELYDVGNYLKTQKIVGMGFRGKVFGDIVTSGLTSEAGQISYQGAPVLADQTYTVLLPDQYLFAAYFPKLKNLGRAEIQFPRLMREIVADYLTEKGA